MYAYLIYPFSLINTLFTRDRRSKTIRIVLVLLAIASIKDVQ